MCGDKLQTVFESLRTVFDEACAHYYKFQSERDSDGKALIYTPSIPVVYFGDAEKYFQSEYRIITVGINPSSGEFIEGHFRKGDVNLVLGAENGDIRDKSLFNILNGYFRDSPYSWFRPFERILNGMGASYCGHMSRRSWSNTAIHTDICTPLATSSPWSKVMWKNRASREELEKKGSGLWSSLVKVLEPDIIVCSLGKNYIYRHFDGTNWTLLKRYENTADGKRRVRPLNIVKGTCQIGGKEALVFNGPAHNIPYGSLDQQSQEQLGKAFLNHYQMQK